MICQSFASCWQHCTIGQHSTIARGMGAIMVLLCATRWMLLMDIMKDAKVSLNPTDKWATWQRTVSFLLSAYLFFLGGSGTQDPSQGPFPKGTWRRLHQVCLHTQSSGSISSSCAPLNTPTCLCSVPNMS